MAQRDVDKTVKSRDLVGLEGGEIFFIQVSRKVLESRNSPPFSRVSRRREARQEKKMMLTLETLVRFPVSPIYM